MLDPAKVNEEIKKEEEAKESNNANDTAAAVPET